MENLTHQEESESEDELRVLPDDVMVVIFAYLTQEELFAARVVCRRWAELALHPDAWRHRKLPNPNSKKGLLRAALALAPRARFLSLSGSTLSILNDDAVLDELADKTHCAIEILDIAVHNHQVGTVARILQTQAKLRRTRKLLLFVYYERFRPSKGWKDLLASLCALENLTELKLHVNGRKRFNLTRMLPLAAPNKSSLKTISCDFANSTWAVFMGRLMEWHAPTLESVSLGTLCNFGSCPLPPSCWGDFLARAVRLRELDCPMLDNMVENLLQCTELETLTLKFGPDFRRGSAVWRAARDYLRKARGLRRLTITRWASYSSKYELTADAAVDLVEALSHSRQPTLEELRCHIVTLNRGQLDRLSAVVLGYLPALRELDVCPGDREAILRLLERLSRTPRTITVCIFTDLFCVNNWVVEQEMRLQACFDRNPGLHIGHMGFWCCTDCRTVRLSGGNSTIVVLYGHPDDVQCNHSQPDTDYIRFSLSGGIEAMQEAQ